MSGFGLILPSVTRRDIFETIPGAIGTGAQSMSANIAVGARVHLGEGAIEVDTLAYICTTATGNVELLILRPTTPGGLVVDVVATTGMVAASGSSAEHAIALVGGSVDLRHDDIIMLNPSSTVGIARATTYVTIGSRKNRFVSKSSAANPWGTSQVTLTAGLNIVPYLAAFKA